MIPFDSKELQHMHYGSPKGVEYCLILQNPNFRAKIDAIMKSHRNERGFNLLFPKKRNVPQSEKEPDGYMMEVIERSPRNMQCYDLGAECYIQ